ncbi:MAG: peptide chain release factor N(5)-glutamine methyltransferase [Clostridia bacterium]|nr:peptide chain release factor N(5)-glutamine methyltransferase [Clostridia bacterium]
MTVSEWLSGAIHALEASGCPDPQVDARWIAEDMLHLTTAELRFAAQNELTDEQLSVLDHCLERRKQGEPVQYILGSADFMGLKFHVDSRVLIPRQDTETLVEAAIVELQMQGGKTVLDMCTGSGCIGLSIKSLAADAEVTLSDISRDALEVASKNAHALALDVKIRHGDLFKAVGREKFDLIVSNPPYLRTDEMHQLQEEVRFEPSLALEAGERGMDFYEKIATEVPKHLNPGGAIYLETGCEQARDVLALLEKHLDAQASGIIRDLCGVERVAWARSK